MNRIIISYKKSSACFKWTYRHFGNDYRVVALSNLYLTVRGIIMQSLTSIGQFKQRKSYFENCVWNGWRISCWLPALSKTLTRISCLKSSEIIIINSLGTITKKFGYHYNYRGWVLLELYKFGYYYNYILANSRMILERHL